MMICRYAIPTTIIIILAVVGVSEGFLLPRTSSLGISSGRVLQASASRFDASTAVTTTKFAIPKDTQVSVLSKDPLVYVIPNLLSPQECEAYKNRVEELQERRPMTKSNPPEVSLELSKLWPLPFLSLAAGIPPWIRLNEQLSTQQQQQQQQQQYVPQLDDIFSVVVPPILLAFVASLALAFGVMLPLIRKVSSDSSRTSKAMAFNLDEDVDFCRSLVDRVSNYTGHPWYSWEAPVVTRYDPGAIFAKHGDASPTLGQEWENDGGQRVITCICYLNDVETGGETYFDELGLGMTPKQGHALVFFPADPVSLRADPRTTHESLPPQEEKWIVQMFGRVGPRVPSPLGLPESYGVIS